MEDLEKLSTEIDTLLPLLGIVELIVTLNQSGINTERRPDIISNKRKLIRLI